MGSVKLLRPQTEQLSPREQARKKYMDSVMKRADKIAFDQNGLVTGQMQHLVIALVHELSEAYLINNELVAQVNNLSAGMNQLHCDIEAIRNAIK